MKKKKMKAYAMGGGIDMIAPALANLIPQAINIGQSASYVPQYDPQAKTGFDFGQMAGAAAGSGGLGPLGIIAGGLNAVGQLVKMNKNKNTVVYGSPGSYASGGDMSLNNQAFKVNAPANQTDVKYYPSMDVKLDNNEVVDMSRKIVYSDDIKNPTTGNSFATDAAKLEYKKGLSQKKVERYKDPFATNTIEALDRMGRDLYSKQEVIATAMGKRDNQGATVQGRAMGGPIDPLMPIARESTAMRTLPMQSFNAPVNPNSEFWGLPQTNVDEMAKINRQQAEAYFRDKPPVTGTPRTTFNSRYRERAYGGPIDPDPQQPYMSIGGDYYYDPYNSQYKWRNPLTGSYKTETGTPGFGTGKGFRPYAQVQGDYLNVLPATANSGPGQKLSISKHLKEYPRYTEAPTGDNVQLTSNEWQGLSEPSMFSDPDRRTFVDPTAPKPTGGLGPRRSPIAGNRYTGPNRPSNSVQSSPTGPVNTPPTDNFRFYNEGPNGSIDDGFRFMDPSGSAPKRFPNFDPLPNPRTSTAAYDPETLIGNPQALTNRTVTSNRALPTAADLNPLSTTAGAPQDASAGRSMFTTGDYIQMAASAASFAPLLQGPQRETPYLDNTQITKQAFDVNPQLYQSGRSYRNAVNSIDTQSPNLRRALQNSMYAQKINQDDQILERYQGLNNQARQQYEANLSNQRRFNIGQTVQTNDLNRRNEGAYNTSLDNAFRTVSNFGKGMNEKQQGQDVMNLFRTQYSDVYDRIIKALTERG